MPRRSAKTLALCVLSVGAAAAVLSCDAPDAPRGPHTPAIERAEEPISAADRQARYAQIRDAAAAHGIDHTAYLLAGIAYAETGLAHCWSEAQWACQGPDSADCGGGPVIAGAGDGPCADRQGGLGMFQFDAGTFDDTLAAYGPDVLTVAGNTQHAIDYVVHMVMVSTYTRNAADLDQALHWVATFDVNDATLRDQWVSTVTRYYNGCQPGHACWDQRYGSYNSALQTVLDETGLAFWQTVVVPPDNLPQGALDAAGCDTVRGWAQDPDTADAPIDVHLYFGGPAGSGAPGVPIHADLNRDDLCGPLGSCAHGFAMAAPFSLFDGAPHPIHAYGIGTGPAPANAELGGSPKDLNCPATLPAGIRRHVIDPTSFTAWKLDAFWDQMPTAPALVEGVAAGADLPALPHLVQADDGSPEVYVVDGALRRHVPSQEVLAAWRFDRGTIEHIPVADVQALTEGGPWRPRPMTVMGGDGAVYLLDDAPPPEPDAALPPPDASGPEADVLVRGDAAPVSPDVADVPDTRDDFDGPSLDANVQNLSQIRGDSLRGSASCDQTSGATPGMFAPLLGLTVVALARRRRAPR